MADDLHAQAVYSLACRMVQLMWGASDTSAAARQLWPDLTRDDADAIAQAVARITSSYRRGDDHVEAAYEYLKERT